MKTKKILIRFGVILSVLSFLCLAACGDNDNVSTPTTTPTADRDAAEAIASDIAYETGGTVDQIADVCMFANADGMTKMSSKYPDRSFVIQKTYNTVTGVWTIHIERERGIAETIPYAYFSRDYTLQYLNASGIAQQHYVAGADTATTILFNVIQGNGRHITRRLSQQLNQLTAHWTVTNANQDIVTINGDYNRAAIDTLSYWNRKRISDHALQLNIQDLTVPRGENVNVANTLSGHITGHFHADITFIQGTAYNEGVVDRDIDITIGSGQGNIVINGLTYRSDISSGELR